MSDFLKRAKSKAKVVVDRLRPPRQGRSLSHTPSGQSIPNFDTNSAATTIPPSLPGASHRLLSPVQTSSTSPLGLHPAQPASSSLSSTPAAAPVYARPPATPSALVTTGSVIHELLTTIRDASDMCLPLKAAIVGVLKIWDVCERTVYLNEEFVKHKEKLQRLLKITTAHQDETGLSDNLQERLEKIATALQNLANAVQAKLDRGLTSRALQSGNDIVEVKDLVDKIMSLIDVFEFEGGVCVEIGVEHVKSGVKQIQRGVDQVEDVIVQLHNGVERAQAEAQDGIDQVQDGVDDINRQLLTAKNLQAIKEREEYLERLKNTIATALDEHHVREAVYDAQQRSGCMEGTRVEVLNQVFRWIRDPRAQPIFWLRGMAGTGKTAIAWSICERVQANDALCLGGSFFCSRSTGSAAQRDVRCVIPTLAQLFARQSNEFAIALAAELKEDPDLAYKQVKVQVERLLHKPLAALSSSPKPVVFVVDALDECGEQPTAISLNNNSDAHAAVSEMLEALIGFCRSSAGLPIKFIITSRPETHIRETSVTDAKVTSTLHLHTIHRSQVTSDIQLYIREMLSKASGAQAWFDSDHVETLTERADGLFIFATTAVKYILGGGTGLRTKRLANLVSPLQAPPNPLVIAPLDLMYSSILAEASRTDVVEADDLQQMLKIVAAILSSRMTLSVQALAELLDLSADYLRGCLDRLHAVVHLPPDNHDASLWTLHASFGDYLFTRAGAGIRIASTLGHDEIARGCLRRMAQGDLSFNISRSPSSHEPNPKTEPNWISLSLHYACLHWAHHIQSASMPSGFEEIINGVFRAKFLFWLEVLSVLGEVRRASGLLRIAGFTVKSAGLSQFLWDANSFVASSRAAIEWSAPHIYLSALPFAPKDSLIFQDFASLLSGVISVETFGIDRHGGRLVMNITGHERAVYSVAYSPDGKLLASGSSDGKVRLWDTLTGEETMAPLQSNDGEVLCVAFTADGRRVVSCADSGDDAIHIWDVRTGRAAMSPLRGHSGAVLSVTLSRDGRLIASGSADKSVRLWDATTGRAIAALTGHEDWIRSVVFSSDGQTLASGSDDSTIRLWNVRTCELQGQPFRGADSYVLSIAFSPDGSFIAAGYLDEQIRIWNVLTGEEIGAPLKAECQINDLVFAPDGSCLASTNLHGIRFWDWRTGEDVAPSLSGHSGLVNTISWSPDGLYIATGSEDRTIRIWDAEHNQWINDQPPSHKGSVNSVAVSADGSFIVSGSADRTIRVWDSQTAELILPPLMGHNDEVLSVAISSDSQFIASGSEDCTVRLWSAKTGEPVGEPLEGCQSRINAVTLSSDGRWLASASNDSAVGLWALASNQHRILHQLSCDYQPLSVAFSSNGQLLAVGDWMGYVTVWNLSTGDSGHTKSARMRANNSDIMSVCFSPGDSRVATASLKGSVYVWDLKTRSLLQTLEGHSGSVRAVAYSPDGECLVSGGDDRTVRIWETSTGQSVTALRGHLAAIASIALLPNKKSLVTGAFDGTIRSWNVVNSAVPSLQTKVSLVEILAQAHQDDGWLVGLSKERFIWLPQEYRLNLVNRRPMIIGSHRIVVSADTALYHGKDWTRCWRGIKLSEPAGSI